MSHDGENMSAVYAIRIYYRDGSATPMADLCMSDGTIERICWVNVKERERFMRAITGYTLIYDERPKCSWTRTANVILKNRQ